MLLENAPADVLHLERQLGQHRLHRRARLLAHVRPAVLEAGRVLALLRQRVDAGDEELGRCDPRGGLVAVCRLHLLVVLAAEQTARDLLERTRHQELRVHPRNAHEALLRHRRAVGARDVVQDLEVVDDQLVRGLLARAVVVLARRARRHLRERALVVEAVPAKTLLLGDDLGQHGLHRVGRARAHVGLAAFEAGRVLDLLVRRVDAGGQVLGRRNPHGGLGGALGRQQAIQRVCRCAEQTATDLVQAGVDLVLLARQPNEAWLGRRWAVGPGDVVQDLAVIHDKPSRGLLARLVAVALGHTRVVGLGKVQIELGVENVPAHVLLVRGHLCQDRAHRLGGRHAHVRLASLVTRNVRHVLRSRLQTRAQVLSRRNPRRGLRRRHARRPERTNAEQPPRHLVQARIDQNVRCRQAHEVGLARGSADVLTGDVAQDDGLVLDELARRRLAIRVIVRRRGTAAVLALWRRGVVVERLGKPTPAGGRVVPGQQVAPGPGLLGQVPRLQHDRACDKQVLGQDVADEVDGVRDQRPDHIESRVAEGPHDREHEPPDEEAEAEDDHDVSGRGVVEERVEGVEAHDRGGKDVRAGGAAEAVKPPARVIGTHR